MPPRQRTGLGAFEQLDPNSFLAQRLRARAATARQTARQGQTADYRRYVESRRDAAEAATNGFMVTPEGRRRGITAAQWFTGRHVSDRYATEEMRDWLAANGPTLSATAFRAQAVDDVPRAANEFLARSSNS